MKRPFNYLIFLTIIFSMFSMASLNAAEVDVERLKEQCNKITAQQRQLASAAGYDIDSICESLSSLTTGSDSDKKKEQKKQFLARGSKLKTDERGVVLPADEQLLEDEELGIESLFLDDDQLNELMGEYDPDAQEQEEDEGLKPFGYELFSGVPTTFAPVTDIAIPVNYSLGPMDVLNIQLIGGDNQNYQLEVDRNGMINFPDIGSISVAGLTFDEAKALLKSRVSEQFIGVTAIINIEELRSIRVFVLGEAFKPGSYSVSSLSTITNALLVSGGITEIASLRNIELKRQGQVVGKLDLYDLLLKGDTSDDQRLEPGDVIYVPPVGKTVGIQGAVNRPAIYELKEESGLQEIIDLAGGVAARGYASLISVERPNQNGFLTTLEYDLKRDASSYEPVAGDLIDIHPVLEEAQGVVTLSGMFHRPRNVSWSEGLRLSDVIKSVADFNRDVDVNAGLIIRQKPPLKQISTLFFSVADILSGQPAFDHELLPMDEVVTFDQATNRVEELLPLNEKINTQAVFGGFLNLVEISGNVKLEGVYPFTEGMTVKQLIALSGGLREATYFGRAEISRREIAADGATTITHFNINLEDLIRGNKTVQLSPRDKLSIYLTPEYQESRKIVLLGEVRFPGLYEFSRGETLTQVISRAGGFTDLAHVAASVFTRQELKRTETQLLEDLENQLQREVAASELGEQAVGGSTSTANVTNAERLLDTLSETEALGRLVIQLEDIMSGEREDILLQDGDRLVVPVFKQEVSVVGEVQRNSSHIFNDNWMLDDYLDGSGGMTDRADSDRLYVVRADGSIFLPNQGGWLTHQQAMISPGDTIVVPLEADRIKTLTLWTNVSQIIYQIALGVAAFNSL